MMGTYVPLMFFNCRREEPIVCLAWVEFGLSLGGD
jgi:hypothetical protein